MNVQIKVYFRAVSFTDIGTKPLSPLNLNNLDKNIPFVNCLDILKETAAWLRGESLFWSILFLAD